MVDIMANQVEHTTQINASIKGLTSEEVRAAQAAGKVNADATVKTRSYGSIFGGARRGVQDRRKLAHW